MKKKLAIIGTVALLGVGAVALSNQEWSANTIFATARDKQLAWLKEHEKEIVKWMHSVYPKVESVQFDWSTLRVGPVSNGVANVEYFYNQQKDRRGGKNEKGISVSYFIIRNRNRRWMYEYTIERTNE